MERSSTNGTSASGVGGTARFVVAWTALALLAIALFLVVVRFGSTLVAPGPVSGERFGQSTGDERVNLLMHVLVALIVIVGAARVMGRVSRRFGQPAVVGEIVAGLMLGPSLLGRFAPGVAAFVLPAQVQPILQVLAQVGVVLFMLLVGVELEPALLRGRARAALAISHASIAFPFCLGALLALYLYPRFSTSDVPFNAFALFLGISMSVTAFPVLARILAERGMDKEPLGALALTCAAIDDVTAWCLLALVVGVVKSHAAGAALTIVLAIGYLAVVVLVVRPVLSRVAERVEQRENGVLGQGELALVLLVVLGSALATEAIGIHALFGAFAVGACVPAKSRLAHALRDRIEDLVLVLLLPVFFALTGMRTQLGLMGGAAGWAACVLVVLVACVGKIGGSALAARGTGLSWRDAGVLGILMNTRGLMELVVLNVGLELNVIGPALFAILVVMAVVTTLSTSPLLRFLGSVPRFSSCPG